METTPISTPTPAPTPAAAPAAAPAPVEVAPTPAPSPSASMIMENGGSTSSGKSFLQSLNWIEIGFSILGVAALSYVIYYYRFKLKQDKMINNELQRQIDELKMNVQSSLKGKYKTI